MRANKLRDIWAAGGAVVNGWLAVPSSFSAEVMAHQGWDSLTVDMQHGVIDYQVAVTMLQAISTTDAAPLCRVPWNDQAIIGKMLDAGVYGVVCPMVNTAEDAERLVFAMRYPPRGGRSFGPIRAFLYAGQDYLAHADEACVAIAQIETPESIENLDAICATRGLDALYIGPADLALGYGKTPRFDHDDPFMEDKIMQVRDAAKRHGLIAGVHCGSVAYSKRMIKEGFQLVTLLSDARLMGAGAKRIVDAMRAEEDLAAAGAAADGAY